MELKQILARSRVRLDVTLASKKAVLEKLSEMLADADPRLSASSVFNSLIARERLGTTGLGAGIAIPHARVATAAPSIGAFIRTREAISFDAVDNAPVDLFFALCVPEEANEEHLLLLSALAERFSNSGFAEQLRRADSNTDVYEALTRTISSTKANG